MYAAERRQLERPLKQRCGGLIALVGRLRTPLAPLLLVWPWVPAVPLFYNRIPRLLPFSLWESLRPSCGYPVFTHLTLKIWRPVASHSWHFLSLSLPLPASLPFPFSLSFPLILLKRLSLSVYISISLPDLRSHSLICPPYLENCHHSEGAGR